MPLPIPHNLQVDHLTVSTASVGASPQAAYIRAPFRGFVLAFYGILRGAITTADATITVAINGTTIGTFTVTQSGSAAGQLFSGQPTTKALSAVNQNDVISFTPSGASGANIGMDFQIAVRAG